jgi:hypothetical protein
MAKDEETEFRLRHGILAHVHVAPRGIGMESRSLHLSREYIRQGMRNCRGSLRTPAWVTRSKHERVLCPLISVARLSDMPIFSTRRSPPRLARIRRAT